MKNQGCSTSSTSCDMRACWEKLLKGALIGGLVMFAWLSISWMVLPWHKTNMRTFKNEAAVSAVLKANADKSGVYMLYSSPAKKMAAKKGKKAVMTAPTGPAAFMAVDLKGGVNDKKAMQAKQGWQFLLCLVSALLLTALLKRGTCCGGCPVAFSALVGLVVGVAGSVPGWIWFHLPGSCTLATIADQVIAFGLAGSVIVRWVCADKGKASGGSCSMK